MNTLSAKYFRCPKRNVHFLIKNRGTFLVDNGGLLRTRVPRKDNIKFIASYLYSNPCSKSATIRKALLQWRGIRVSDKTRGQYTSYFYDFHHGKWYYKKLWEKIKPQKPMAYGTRLNLTLEGMKYVDFELAEKLKVFDFTIDRVKFFITDRDDIEKLEGHKYKSIIPEKFKTEP